MNKPTNKNIRIVKSDGGVGIVVDYNYELWECIVNLEEYRCYGCLNSQDLEALLSKSLDSSNLLFTFYEDELKIDFTIDLGFKTVFKDIVIPKVKVRQLTEVEKMELYIEEQKSTIDRLSHFLDYVVIGNSLVSISQTKKLKICSYSSWSRIPEWHDFGKGYSVGFTVVFIPGEANLLNTPNISNIKYLKNIEELVIVFNEVDTHNEISDLSFLELPKLTYLCLRLRCSCYTGKTLIIPNLELLDNQDGIPIKKSLN